MDVKIYDAQADTISVDDIATNSNNRIAMRRIKRNEADAVDDNNSNALYIRNYHYDEGDGCVDYCPEGAYDMGWMGYFAGKNKHLQELNIRPFEPTSGSSVRVSLNHF